MECSSRSRSNWMQRRRRFLLDAWNCRRGDVCDATRLVRLEFLAREERSGAQFSCRTSSGAACARRELTSGYKCKFVLISFRRPEKESWRKFVFATLPFLRPRAPLRNLQGQVCSFFFSRATFLRGPHLLTGTHSCGSLLDNGEQCPFRECKYELWRERRSSDRIKNLYGIL